MEDDKIPLDPELGIDPEELSNELEGLKDLVQDEITKMMNDNPDTSWRDVVLAAKDEKEKAKLAKSLPTCECCGEAFEGENAHYCDNCLEGMKHYPFEWWKLFIPVLAVALVLLSFSFFAISWPVYQGAVNAEQLASEGKLMSALNKYDAVNTEIKVTDKNYGGKYLRRQVAIYDAIGTDSYEELNNFIDEHFPGIRLENPENASVKAVKEKITSFNKIYDYFMSAYSKAKSYDEFVKQYDKETADKDLEKSLVAYYKYYASLIYEAPSATQLKNIDAIKAADPEFKSLYLPLYAEYYLNQKDYKAVLKYTADLEKYNSESVYVFLYKTVAYRLEGNINMAFTICQKGLNISSSDPMLNYQMGVICLIQGKQKEAKNYASIAYQNADNPNSYTSAASLYSLCAKLTGDEETYESISEEVGKSGYEISGDVSRILDGTLTIEDVFTKDRGDFSWD